MLRSAIVFSAALLGATIAHASSAPIGTAAYRAPRSIVSPSSELASVYRFDGAPIIILPETIVTARAPRPWARPARRWACGAVEINAIGGAQRTCSWVP